MKNKKAVKRNEDFFIRTEEKVITREDLKKGRYHTKYLANISCDDKNGEKEYISGMGMIQEK